MTGSGFYGSPSTGPAPLVVNFNDTSAITPASWLRDSGDGGTTNPTVRNPVHTYTTPGISTVVPDCNGCRGSQYWP